MQAASTVFLVRPARFGYNAETALSNHFQHPAAGLDAAAVQARAAAEFDAAGAALRAAGVRVRVFDDTPAPAKPDAVFPNNWVTLHADGRVLLYPMCAPSRRPERRADIVAALGREFAIREVVDLSGAEAEGRFLEGTGSLVFDHAQRVVYAALSARTDADLLAAVAARLGYRPVAFRALDARGRAIYHTNVMLFIGSRVAGVCLASIRDAAERAAVVDSLTAGGHAVVDLSLAQVARFAGNALALQPAAGPELLALSQSAYAALTPAQRRTLERFVTLLPLAIPTIESAGGGSVRCMLAEVFLPARSAAGAGA